MGLPQWYRKHQSEQQMMRPDDRPLPLGGGAVGFYRDVPAPGRFTSPGGAFGHGAGVAAPSWRRLEVAPSAPARTDEEYPALSASVSVPDSGRGSSSRGGVRGGAYGGAYGGGRGNSRVGKWCHIFCITIVVLPMLTTIQLPTVAATATTSAPSALPRRTLASWPAASVLTVPSAQTTLALARLPVSALVWATPTALCRTSTIPGALHPSPAPAKAPTPPSSPRTRHPCQLLTRKYLAGSSTPDTPCFLSSGRSEILTATLTNHHPFCAVHGNISAWYLSY